MMHKSMLERPALFISELGLLAVGLVLAGIGFATFSGAFSSDRLAFLGAIVFLLASVWCCALSLIALSGRPRSAVAKGHLDGGRVGGRGLSSEFGLYIFRRRVHSSFADRGCRAGPHPDLNGTEPNACCQFVVVPRWQQQRTRQDPPPSTHRR